MTPCRVYAAVAATCAVSAAEHVVCGVMSSPSEFRALSIAFGLQSVPFAAIEAYASAMSRGATFFDPSTSYGLFVASSDVPSPTVTPILPATWLVEQTEIFSAIAMKPEFSESRVKLYTVPL